MICVLPLFHIFALTVVLLRCLRRGHLISLHQRFDVEAVMRDIEVKRATSFPGVPTMWIAIASLARSRQARSVVAGILRLRRRAVAGGSGEDPGAPGRHEAEERLGHDRDLLARHRASKGRPGQAGLDRPDAARHRDSTWSRSTIRRKLLPTGEVGEIRIRGPNVTKGYWNRPQETAEAFVGDRFLTGDIGYMDADGYFYLVDRKKDMIISGGFNVYPQMIEQAIYEHPAVQEVIVIGIPDDYRGEAAKAFVKLRPGAEPFTLDELQGIPHRQARQARNSRSARFRRRTAAHIRRQALAPRTAQPAAGAAKLQQLASGGRPDIVEGMSIVDSINTTRLVISGHAREKLRNDEP